MLFRWRPGRRRRGGGWPVLGVRLRPPSGSGGAPGRSPRRSVRVLGLRAAVLAQAKFLCAAAIVTPRSARFAGSRDRPFLRQLSFLVRGIRSARSHHEGHSSALSHACRVRAALRVGWRRSYPGVVIRRPVSSSASSRRRGDGAALLAIRSVDAARRSVWSLPYAARRHARRLLVRSAPPAPTTSRPTVPRPTSRPDRSPGRLRQTLAPLFLDLPGPREMTGSTQPPRGASPGRGSGYRRRAVGRSRSERTR